MNNQDNEVNAEVNDEVNAEVNDEVNAEVNDEVNAEVNVGCEHYVRQCLLVAPCCDKTYVCRHCHNDAETHEMDRHAVKEVVCAACNTRQTVSQPCSNESCGIRFAAYFCAVCNFFDDRIERNYYHCDKCGICRVKGDNEFIHCDTCGTCVNALNHRCKAEQFHTDCPICLEYLFHSVKPVHVPECGHPIHVQCMMSCMQQNRTGCPLCRKTMMSPESLKRHNESMDALIRMFAIQETIMFAIRCNDCDFTGEVQFHPYGMKCGGCGGYNTAR